MISVCIATYNGERYIEEQLRSVLRQLEDGDEVIISDDGSTDHTLDVLNSFADKRVKVYGNSIHCGVTNNFSNAIVHSSGDYIFLCDQDDVWKDNKVKQCMEILQHADLVLHDMEFMDAEGHEMGMNAFSFRRPGKGVLYNLYKNSFTGCCMAFRREVLKYVMPIPLSVPMYDQWIGMLVSYYGRVELITDSLICYRRHDRNVTGNGEQKSRLPLWRQMMNRLRMVILIFRRIVRR